MVFCICQVYDKNRWKLCKIRSPRENTTLVISFFHKIYSHIKIHSEGGCLHCWWILTLWCKNRCWVTVLCLQKMLSSFFSCVCLQKEVLRPCGHFSCQNCLTPLEQDNVNIVSFFFTSLPIVGFILILISLSYCSSFLRMLFVFSYSALQSVRFLGSLSSAVYFHLTGFWMSYKVLLWLAIAFLTP